MAPDVALVLGGYDRSLIGFRGPLLHAMHEAGWRVVAAAPAEDPKVKPELAALGAEFRGVKLSRTGTNPWNDFRSFMSCVALIRATRPTVFLAYTLKPVGLGCLAASLCGVPRVYALITGLGSAFMTAGVRGWILSCLAGGLYRLSLQRCTKVFVQNAEIGRFLLDRGLVDRADRLVVVPGSGIDLRHFSAEPMPSVVRRFLFLGRLLRDKGVFELVSAAGLVRAVSPGIEVVLVGGSDANASSIPAAQIATWRQEGAVTIQDPVGDVRPHLAACSVFVLPSYHEGLPRSVVEAMATGRPIITSDTIGCRDTVFETGPADADGVKWGQNGAVVPVGNSKALAAAMLRFVREPELAVKMGRESLKLAEYHFKVERVNQLMMSEMEMIPGMDPTGPLHAL